MKSLKLRSILILTLVTTCGVFFAVGIHNVTCGDSNINPKTEVTELPLTECIDGMSNDSRYYVNTKSEEYTFFFTGIVSKTTMDYRLIFECVIDVKKYCWKHRDGCSLGEM